MPTAENQLTWLRLHLGYIGPLTLQDHHRQTLVVMKWTRPLCGSAAMSQNDFKTSEII